MKITISSLIILLLIAFGCTQENIYPTQEPPSIQVPESNSGGPSLLQLPTTSLTAPTISLIGGSPQSFTIAWSKIDNETDYKVLLSRDENFSNLIVNEFVPKNSLSFMEYTFNDLNIASVYYVRVFAVILNPNGGLTNIEAISPIQPPFQHTTHNGVPDLTNPTLSCNAGSTSSYTIKVDFPSVPGDGVFSSEVCERRNTFGRLYDCDYGYEISFQRWDSRGYWTSTVYHYYSSIVRYSYLGVFSDLSPGLHRTKVRTIWPNGDVSEWSEFYQFDSCP